MGSRSLILIMIIGVVGMAAFGFLTKVVFDSNKSLQKITKFKVECLEAFGARGMEGINYRKTRQPMGVTLEIIAQPERVGGGAAIHREIAAYYTEAFPHASDRLQIQYFTQPRLGCGSPTRHREEIFSTRGIRREIKFLNKASLLSKKIVEWGALELLETTLVNDDESRLDVSWDGKLDSAPTPQAITQKIARFFLQGLMSGRQHVLHVRLLGKNHLPKPAPAVVLPAGVPAGRVPAGRAPSGGGGSEVTIRDAENSGQQNSGIGIREQQDPGEGTQGRPPIEEGSGEEWKYASGRRILAEGWFDFLGRPRASPSSPR